MTSVLVLNAGSSSLKFAVIDPSSGDRSLTGVAERLVTNEATIRVDAGDVGETTLDGDDHAAAVRSIVAMVERLPPGSGPDAIGHRVVHGGERFRESVVLDDEVRAAIDAVSRLAPLHNPPALVGIDQARAVWPELPQVAVFDTSFHHTIPAHAHRYAIPRGWYEEHAVRRYGFHGISVRYVVAKTAELLGRPIEELAIVVAHLGNGCSATAVLAGASVETTMGLTPLEGLMMGTRSGDIDPAVFGYLRDVAGLGEPDVTDALNKDSGLVGLSGVSNDMREVRAAADSGDSEAALAIAAFNYRLARAIASLVVGLGRLDVLVFSAGIGEHDAQVRASVVGHLSFLGLDVDAAANAADGRDSGGRIGSSDGPAVLVVPTDEELMIATDTARLTRGGR
jgi:acetate kinase